MTQTSNSAAAHLLGRANRVAFRGYTAETARGGSQHALAIALLCTMSATNQMVKFVAEATHAGFAASGMPTEVT